MNVEDIGGFADCVRRQSQALDCRIHEKHHGASLVVGVPAYPLHFCEDPACKARVKDRQEDIISSHFAC
jgi:hypothetical protein